MRFFKKKTKKETFVERKQRELRRKSIKTKKERVSLRKRLNTGIPNPLLIFIVGILLTFGLLMVYSASLYYASQPEAIESGVIQPGDPFSVVKSQMIWVFLGISVSIVFYFFPLKKLKDLSPLFLGVGVMLLIYILPEALFGRTIIGSDGTITVTGLQMPLVEALNGAPRWINFGFTNLQPSEFVKFAFAIYMAAWLTKPRNIATKNASIMSEHIKHVIVPFLCLLGFVSLLILVQRDFDTTVILVLTTMIIYYVSGTDFIHTMGTIVILISSFIFGLLALLIEDYRRERVLVWLDILMNGVPSKVLSSAFQVWNGLVGLGSGGATGTGYGDSVIKQGYLQEAAYTDSIFVVIGEEFGLIGTVTVILLFLFFISVGLNIAQNAEDRFERLLALGMTSLIGLQGFLNIASVLSVIPFGGMPLPFFTYGGSTTISTLMAVGVLANVSKRQGKN